MPEEKNSHILKAIKDYGRGLLSFIRKRVSSDADAEDILQDVWYQLSAMINADPVEQTGAWLYRVARNKIVDSHRKKREALLDGFDDDEEDEALEIKELMLTEPSTPETMYLRNLFWEELYAALNELSPEQREAFVWQELEGKPFAALAEQTGENIQTLVSRKRYAVLHLRRRLRQLYDDLIND